MIKKYLSAIVLVTLVSQSVVISCQKKNNDRLQQNNDRLNQNVSALTTDIEYYKTETGKFAAKNNGLTLTLKELQNNFKSLHKEHNELSDKYSKLKSISETKYEVSIKDSVVLRDSIVVRDSIPVTIKRIDIHDKYYDLIGSIDGDKMVFDFKTSLDIIQDVSVDYKHKFLFWRWGVKGISQRISWENPYVSLKYANYIEIR